MQSSAPKKSTYPKVVLDALTKRRRFERHKGRRKGTKRTKFSSEVSATKEQRGKKAKASCRHRGGKISTISRVEGKTPP